MIRRRVLVRRNWDQRGLIMMTYLTTDFANISMNLMMSDWFLPNTKDDSQFSLDNAGNMFRDRHFPLPSFTPLSPSAQLGLLYSALLHDLSKIA